MIVKYTIECIAVCAFGIDADSTIMLFYYSFLRAILRFMSQNSIKKNIITTVMYQRQYKPSRRNDFVYLVLSWMLKN